MSKPFHVCADVSALEAVPAGWYWVASSSEVRPGRSRAVRLFGQELVVFRGQSGTPTLMAAHCPHLGAHMGHGGRVEGDQMVCPFHGWRFEADGRLGCVPYSDKQPKLTQRTWPLCEVSGQLLAWHHPGGEAPSWEPDALVDGGSGLVPTRRWTAAPEAGTLLAPDDHGPGIQVSRSGSATFVCFAVPRDVNRVELVTFVATRLRWPGFAWLARRRAEAKGAAEVERALAPRLEAG